MYLCFILSQMVNYEFDTDFSACHMETKIPVSETRPLTQVIDMAALRLYRYVMYI